MKTEYNLDDYNLLALLLLSITASVIYKLTVPTIGKKQDNALNKDISQRLAFIIWINKNSRPLHKTVRDFVKEHHNDKGVQLMLLTNRESVSDLKSLPSSLEIGDITKLRSFTLQDGRTIDPQVIIQSSIDLTLNMDSHLMLAVASDFIRLLVLARPKVALEQMLNSNSTQKKQLLSDLDGGADVMYTDSDVKIDLSQTFTGMFPVFNIPSDTKPYYFFRNDVMYSSLTSRDTFLSIVTALLSHEKYKTFQNALTGIERSPSLENISEVVKTFEADLQSFLPKTVVHPVEITDTSRLWAMALAGFHPAAVLDTVSSSDDASPVSLRECMHTGNLVVFASREVESKVVSRDNLPCHDTNLCINGRRLALSDIAFKQLSHELPSTLGKSWEGSGDLSNMEAARMIHRSPHPI
ncbi:MAG: hypothetical protein CMF55_02205 [Legionellales bacterium]|nr:hypothetical protein [Legionellales bacterium]